LADAQQAARHTLADLRDLATGIYPAVLADQGLVEAVATLAARLPLEVTIDTAHSVRGARFPAEMEGCAYFLVSEALANAMKHAAARHVGIAITRSGSDLAVRVTDDGRGFDLSTARLRGIEGLRDRIEAVGGSFDLHSAPGEGTRIAATLPTRATTNA
jgi:signal transduction histidine kinase